jgi:DNA helicase-2/ATP-dependent DNA helicase PcrA
LSHPIVTEEQALLERVSTLLEEAPYIAPPREAELTAELARLREEVLTAKEEDKPAILQQYEYQFAIVGQLRASRAETGQVDPDSPYFAHIRVVEDERRRDVFIGKATRVDRGIRIVDWRNAPISKVFYRYQQGEVYEEELGGRMVAGEVLVRRTVAIRLRTLERVEAPEGIFRRDPDGTWSREDREAPRLSGGEGSAVRAHAEGAGSDRRLGTLLSGERRRVDKHLPDIAGLLDPEQFDLITRPSSGFVVIRGAAGSGKTTVALHRIAFLAFDDPSVNSERTMFVVFSPALREYVAHVLPALGVGRVQIRDFRSWANYLRKRHFPKLPAAVRDDAPAAVVRLKLHPALMMALERQVANRAGPATVEKAIDDWLSVLTNRAQLEDILREVDPGAFSAREMDQIEHWTRDRAEEIHAWLERLEDNVPAALDEEDDAILLRAHQLRAGPLRGKGGSLLTFRHIAVDEVQDFSPLEVRVLIGCLDRHRSITLAGDTQQHVMKDAGFTSWSAFFAYLGLEGVAVETLRIAYRSARPIVEFGQAMLGDLREDEEAPLVTREGPPVERFRFTDHGAAVGFLADVLRQLLRDEPSASIALLCPDSTIATTYAAGLIRSEIPRVRRVEGHEFTFTPGIEVCEIPQVKGLEFDYVVLVEASANYWPDTPSSRRILHVGATRAVHQLWVMSVGEPTPIVASIG